MNAVFQNHIVVCGWNKRARKVITHLQALSKRPILVVHTDIPAVLSELGERTGIFLMRGDASEHAVLLRADVGNAYSVLVLALDELGASADGRSVQIALAVERIRTAVYTVVELRDIQNKSHFSWTKVDDLVTDQEIAVRVFAQAIRHVTSEPTKSTSDERKLLGVYRRLIDPHQHSSKIFRIDLDWARSRHLTFADILRAGVGAGALPVALVGFRRHRQPETGADADAWISWKGDVLANPPPTTPLSELWPAWPKELAPLGVLIMARNIQHAQCVRANIIAE